MNKISQTIMENLKSTREEYDVQWDRYIGENYEDCELFWDNLKSHLLQSQIRLLEAVIEGMKEHKNEVEFCLEHIGTHTCLGCPKILKRPIEEWAPKVLEDQISSLTQVKQSIQEALNK